MNYHGCPKHVWEQGIAFLLPEYKTMAEERLGDPDLKLMETDVQKDWVYFTTMKNSEKMERVIQIYLESLAWRSYGAW